MRWRHQCIQVILLNDMISHLFLVHCRAKLMVCQLLRKKSLKFCFTACTTFARSIPWVFWWVLLLSSILVDLYRFLRTHFGAQFRIISFLLSKNWTLLVSLSIRSDQLLSHFAVLKASWIILWNSQDKQTSQKEPDLEQKVSHPCSFLI